MSNFLDLFLFNNHILSIVTFLPIVGAIFVFFVKNAAAAKRLALAVALIDFLLMIPLLLKFDKSTHMMQYVERYEWIPSLNINYVMGVDGISVLFIFLTALIGWICILASWTSVNTRVKEYMAALLVMQSAMIGVFCALDFFMFYIFWEMMLIPMYLIIGVWGGPKRVYSALKFFLYTLVGSILMLVGIIALYLEAGSTFDILELMNHSYSFGFQVFVFVLFFIAFAVKVPMFPFHTWLPDAHVQAPTAGSIILAGVLLKMGTYGFLRFSMPMFPDATQYFAFPIIILSIIGIIYGAFLALSQTDMKKLIAYSSVSHMGFVTMGLFLFNVNGMEGGILQMFNHGITTGALFLCVGMIYERTHTRDLTQYGWGAKLIPFYSFFLFLFTMSSIGFPGTSGFIGELLILLGAYEANKIYIIFLLVGVIAGAGYMLWMYREIAFGVLPKGHVSHGGHDDDADDGEHPRRSYPDFKVSDVNAREVVAILALLVFVFWVGFHPMDFLSYMHESVNHLIEQVTGNAPVVLDSVKAIK